MNENGGIMDDCIITKVTDDHFYVVLNAACKDKDFEHFNQYLEKFPGCNIEYKPEVEQSLIAV
jgi:aminomethyltransferase